ncbi:arginyltransferase [Psychromonas algicola]|uniref:arginyltransferase n=1 Tax=Psychromonas algicola TaxID=2555642 RepID=UPI001067FA57|nr:arginyltransferase [Psychromonas sp. RZ5]TEW47655.1 arginyltransferase [Psychromonas sp. RZ5]
MSEPSDLSVGLTGTFPCSYLDEQEEQLIMLIDPEVHAPQHYLSLMAIGFRRSGDQVYRPHCPNCNACESLRISPAEFVLSKSQKRLLNKNKHFNVKQSNQIKSNYFQLYERYINKVHRDGVMYPASLDQFESFMACAWGNVQFIEIYDEEKLIAVSVTDQLENATSIGWSAFYCFYDPDYTIHSLGKYAVLQQLKLAKEQNITFLYLGYYIHNCQKMNYKNQFNPHQRFINQQWVTFD